VLVVSVTTAMCVPPLCRPRRSCCCECGSAVSTSKVVRGMRPAKGSLFVPSHAAVLWHALACCAVRAMLCCAVLIAYQHCCWWPWVAASQTQERARY
jgi:hypothetical protein